MNAKRITCTASAFSTPDAHSRPHRPRGAALLELLVALPLLALLASVALMLLLGAQRAAQQSDRTLTASHELRHASAVLAAALRPLAARDLVAWSDTTIEFVATVGTGIVCDGIGPRDRVQLLAAGATDPARTHTHTPPQLGDEITVFLPPADTSFTPTPYNARVRSVAGSNGCAASPLIDSSPDLAASTLTVRLYNTLPANAVAGTPARITRHVRFTLYRSGTGWFLGRQERDNSGWDITQPVAGPLQSPLALGLLVQVRDRYNTPLVTGDSGAAVVRIELRAPARVVPRGRTGRTTIIDSTAIELALRAESGHEQSPDSGASHA